jgi:hypothetical protein
VSILVRPVFAAAQRLIDPYNYNNYLFMQRKMINFAGHKVSEKVSEAGCVLEKQG